jgi:hypothetical protein
MKSAVLITNSRGFRRLADALPTNITSLDMDH